MKVQYTFLLFLAGFILQSTVMNHFVVFGIGPNIILCLTALISFLFEGYYGLIFGLIFGLILDFCFAPIIGTAALCLFVVSLLCMKMKMFLYKESLISVLIVSAAATIGYSLISAGIISMLGINYSMMQMVRISGILLLYNGVITLILYYFLSRKVIKHRSDLYMYRNTLQEAKSIYK